MRVEEEQHVERKAIFSREEILEKLGVDLEDFYLAELDHQPQRLVLRYFKGGTT